MSTSLPATLQATPLSTQLLHPSIRIRLRSKIRTLNEPITSLDSRSLRSQALNSTIKVPPTPETLEIASTQEVKRLASLEAEGLAELNRRICGDRKMAVTTRKLYPRATIKKILKAHTNKNVSRNVDILVFLNYSLFLEHLLKESIILSKKSGEKKLSARSVRKCTEGALRRFKG